MQKKYLALALSGLLATALTGCGGSDNDSNYTEPTEHPTTDAGKGDAGKGDAGKGDAGKGDAGKGDAGKGDAGKGDAGKGDAGKGDAGKGDAGKGDAGKGDAGKGDAGKGDAGKGDAGKGDAGKGDAGKGDAGKGDAGKGDAGKGDAGKGDAGKGDAGKGDAGKDTTKPSVGVEDKVDNPGGAAVTPKKEYWKEKSSSVGQQYIRGSSADFDEPHLKEVKGANGNTTVPSYVSIQNKELSNIVVAQFKDETKTDGKDKDGNVKFKTVKYLLGETPTPTPAVNNAQSLQTHNEANVESTDEWRRGIIHVTKKASVPAATVTNQDSLVADAEMQNTKTNQVSGLPAGAKNQARFYGNLYSTATDLSKVKANSTMYEVINGDGKEVSLEGKDKAGKATFNIKDTKLNHVQYGRVTGNLENIKQPDLDALGDKTYKVAQLADKNFAGNTTQTDVYFYRGLDETQAADMPKSGTFHYAGHALMYGIDNSYRPKVDDGESNSVAFGTNGTAVGNFVKAEYDVGKKAVKGSIYNVWKLDAPEGTEFKAQDLVTFNGDVTRNSIRGTAERTYRNGKAVFKGSFFGKNAAEMGGAINSIEQGFGKSQWGGVFGAKQLPKTPKTTPPQKDDSIPPTAAVD